MPTIQVWIEGVCRHEGTARARGGYGVCFNEGRQFKGTLCPDAPQTSRRAKLAAVLRALEETRREQQGGGFSWSSGRPHLHEVNVTVLSHSEYVVDACSDWLNTWIENGFRDRNGQPVENEDIFRNIFELLVAPEFSYVTFDYVPTHSPMLGFEDALRLANQAIDEAVGT